MNEPYALIRSKRKTLSLQVKRDGSLLVRAPLGMPEARIERFLAEKEAWIEKTRKKLEGLPELPDDEESVRVLKERAAAVLPQKVAFYARKTGLFPSSVKIGKAKTRYGCCTDKKHVVFSCYLMLCPEEAIDLVVVHELAHLRYMDHGKKFYALIDSVLPDRKEREKALKSGRKQTDLVPLDLFLPEAVVDLRYAGTDNFTGQRIYESGEAFLRYGTVKKLKSAAKALKGYGLRLKILDAYRPAAAQRKLWEVCPDPRFVADPAKGSDHTRGSAIDLTLCTPDGTELEMPSAYDEFSDRARRDHTNCTENAKKNVLLLEKSMRDAGFLPYEEEWWHYTDSDLYELIG